MRTKLAFVGLGLWTVFAAASTFSCASDDDKPNNPGMIVEAGPDTGGASGQAGQGGTSAGGSSGTGVGGTAGAAGDAGGGRLGVQCSADTDCGQGLTCVTANSGAFDGKGPAKGYCTTDCSGDAATCTQFGQEAVCVNFGSDLQPALYCVQGCTFGPVSNQPNPNKCRGRGEVSCAPLFSLTGTACTTDANCAQGELCDPVEGCLQVIPACLPQCNADADCGAGLFCDPQDGLCSTTEKRGLELGASCNQPDAGGVDECRGTCIGLVVEAGGEPLTTMCAENCTVNAIPSCGWAGPASGVPAPGFCFFASTIVIEGGGPGTGDRGSCAKLCNCNADCTRVNPDLICSPLPGNFVQALSQQGLCTLPETEDGAIDPGIPSCGATDAGGG